MLLCRGKTRFLKMTITLEKCIVPPFQLFRSFTTADIAAEERAKKLRALFGATAAGKPTGMPISTITNVTDTKKDGEEGKVVVKDEEDGKAAERAWLESGYIEYMDNQRDKGWKS